MPVKPDNNLSRRDLLALTVRGAAVLGAAGVVGAMVHKAQAARTVWQLDPSKCIACGKCATECVLEVSAVKCVHAFDICGYCKLCSGYSDSQSKYFDSDRKTAAENQNCPVGAIKRNFVEDPYYEYFIDEKLCFACGKCVDGCTHFGNGSLFLQVRHDRCINCNQCRIALNCPSQAFERVPADHPYKLKRREHTKEEPQ
jgi:Na+-translocating ferredoxin:NAD+ oxidoreductase subunit B